MRTTISKEFTFEFGHRVWSQTGFTINKCRHIHGHSGLLKISLTSPTLNNGMVIDFNHLAPIKTIIDNHIDHKFLIDRNDPLLLTFLKVGFPTLDLNDEKVLSLKFMNWVIPITMSRRKDNQMENSGEYIIGHKLDLQKLESDSKPCDNELLNSLLILDFLPTAENISAWFYGMFSYYFRAMDVEISSIQFHETSKSSACYESTNY